jgi:hypothetical protein
LAGRYQRRTTLLSGVLESIAVMLAGRPGARLANRLRVAVSRVCCACYEPFPLPCQAR